MDDPKKTSLPRESRYLAIEPGSTEIGGKIRNGQMGIASRTQNKAPGPAKVGPYAERNRAGSEAKKR